MSCCVDTVNGAPSGSGGASFLTGNVYELDFSAEPDSGLLATGTTVIDGQTWTQQVVAADTMQIVNGSGLEIVLGATSTSFTGAAFTSSWIYLPVSTMHTLVSCDQRDIVEVEIFASTLTLLGTASLVFGLWGQSGVPASSGSRLVAAERIRTVNVQVFRARTASAAGNSYTGADDYDTLSVRSTATSVACASAAQWAGSWPTTYPETQNAPQNLLNSERHPESRLTMAAPTGGITSAGTTLVIERLRVRSWVLSSP